MYLPTLTEETRLDVLHDLICAHSLGTWVTADVDELCINHVPFVLDAKRGELGTLTGHVARANPIWQLAESRMPSAIVFRGPQTYITPSWYLAKHEHGKVVPTWNYAVVTVHGRPRFIEDPVWLRRHLERLTSMHEVSQPSPWQIDDAPEDFTEMLISNIVGVEIPVERIVGKWKTSQNRPQSDKIGVINGLLEVSGDEAVAMASLVQQHL